MVMVAAPINLISLDERGVAYIAGTKMKVAQIAVESTRLGYSPEDILDSHSHLTLEQIHAALSYYYGHKNEIDAFIAEQDRIVEELRAKATNQVTRAELEARRQAQLEQIPSPANPKERVCALLAKWRTEDNTPTPSPIPTRNGETPTQALFRKWEEEDSAMTEEEREAEDRLWQDIEKSLHENRFNLGSRHTAP